MARLSVNLNKVALLRNSRHTGVPDMLKFAQMVIDGGALGITLHPRPDERHVRRSDVPAIAALMQPHRPKIELNIEGYPDARFIEIAREVRPEQCTLVPDSPSAFTSEKGWDLDDAQMAAVMPIIAELKKLGSRVILFVDADPSVVARVAEAGADGIEIYTGTYAAAFRTDSYAAELDACAATAAAAKEKGLAVNIGHDLNLQNIPLLIERAPFIAEASIGHELTAGALEKGFAATVQAYINALAN